MTQDNKRIKKLQKVSREPKSFLPVLNERKPTKLSKTQIMMKAKELEDSELVEVLKAKLKNMQKEKKGKMESMINGFVDLINEQEQSPVQASREIYIPLGDVDEEETDPSPLQDQLLQAKTPTKIPQSSDYSPILVQGNMSRKKSEKSAIDRERRVQIIDEAPHSQVEKEIKIKDISDLSEIKLNEETQMGLNSSIFKMESKRLSTGSTPLNSNPYFVAPVIGVKSLQSDKSFFNDLISQCGETRREFQFEPQLRNIQNFTEITSKGNVVATEFTLPK